MSFGGGVGSPPPVPQVTDPSIQAAAQAQANAQAQAAGRASTILTSGTGVATPPATNKKQLLGQ